VKRRSNFLPTPAGAVRTGEHCPHTGWWRPVAEGVVKAADEPRFLAEGGLMPAAEGIPGSWLPHSVRVGIAPFQELVP
jgi:hypothetical protein